MGAGLGLGLAVLVVVSGCLGRDPIMRSRDDSAPAAPQAQHPLTRAAPRATASAGASEAPCTLRIEGQQAIITCPLPPPVVPPPVVPPVVLPPVVPPPRDPTPFPFPTNCNTRPVDAAERAIWAWEYPGDYQNFYAYLDGTGNPLSNSHTCAGIFAPTAVTPDGRSLKDAKLWVPRSAGTARPWDIRCVLATGRVCP